MTGFFLTGFGILVVFFGVSAAVLWPGHDGNPGSAVLAAAAIASQQNSALLTANLRASWGGATAPISSEDETSTFPVNEAASAAGAAAGDDE